jgi:hypothetical protein
MNQSSSSDAFSDDFPKRFGDVLKGLGEFLICRLRFCMRSDSAIQTELAGKIHVENAIYCISTYLAEGIRGIIDFVQQGLG